MTELAVALEEGRALHEARMTDTFMIKRSLGVSYQPAPIDAEVEAFEDLFATPGYFARGARSVRGSEAGGRTVIEEPAEVRIPWNSDAVPANAVAVCTATGPATPDRMLGRILRVDGSGGDGSQRTHYPLQVTEYLT